MSAVSTPSPLEAELAQCALSRPEPDHHRFDLWLAGQYAADPTLGLVFNRFSPLGAGATSRALELIEEMRALEQRYRAELQAFGGTPGVAQQDLQHRLRLLASALRGSARGGEVEDARATVASLPADLDEGLDDCTQAQLRLRLFASLQREQWRTVFKIIGRLRQASHDPGELAYLEALARFHDHDFAGCERYAAQVGADDVDFAAASALSLESLAYLGSVPELLQRLRARGTAGVSPMFLRYLMQVAVLNSNDAEAAARMLQAAQAAEPLEIHAVAPQDDPFVRPFNRHSCAVATRLLEAIDAAQVARSLSPAEDADEESPGEPATERLLLALWAGDPDLVQACRNAPREDRAQPIVLRLMGGLYDPGLADITQALAAQLRLGSVDAFIDNMVDMLMTLHGNPWPAAIVDLMRAAWVEAAARRHPSTARIAAQLQALPGTAAQTPQDAIERRQRLVFLSPMGQLAYAWAEDALEAAERADRWHGDAGMISLGFFRILEHEMNEWLVAPMRGNQVAGDALQALWAQLDPQLSADGVGKAASKRRDAHEMWSRLIPQVQAVIGGKRSGLELGSLGMLMDKSRSTSGDDLALKQWFAGQLTARLNADGRTAFADGVVSRLIAQNATERFRNPAAHARYVSLPTARDCKRHVDEALASLARWSTP